MKIIADKHRRLQANEIVYPPVLLLAESLPRGISHQDGTHRIVDQQNLYFNRLVDQGLEEKSDRKNQVC